jgi:hypothetical protein
MNNVLKYMWCEFGYTHKKEGSSRDVLLTYTGRDDGQKQPCERCGKTIKGKAHTFTGEYGEQWLFGPDCVKKVFAAGIGTGDVK